MLQLLTAPTPFAVDALLLSTVTFSIIGKYVGTFSWSETGLD